MKYTNSQSLLFDQTPYPFTVGATKEGIDESFYTKGYVVVDGISTPAQAHAYLEDFFARVNPDRFSLYKQLLERLQLAKLDQLPVCHDLLDATYQSIHMDMGHPLAYDGQSQNMFFFTALLFPQDHKPSQGITRLVTLNELMKQKKWGSKEEVRARLESYVDAYGDGKPEYNTKRLASVARLFDAMMGQAELVDFRDQRTDEWFQNGAERNEAQSLQNEYAFFKKAGYDLAAVEERVNLQPGQMIIFDNTRIGHGRLGHREAAELYQFMYGVKDLQQDDIQAIQDHFVNLLAE